MPGGYCGQGGSSSSDQGAPRGTAPEPSIPPLPGEPFPPGGPHEEIPQTQCGNGTPETGEMCDDGNLKSFDGCSRTCMREAGWQCYFECRPTAAKTGFFRSLFGSLFPFFADTAQTFACHTYCTEVCGDTMRVGSEQCDLGTGVNGNGSSTCGKDCRLCPVPVYCPSRQIAEGQMNAQGCFVPTGRCVPEGMDITPAIPTPTPATSTCGNGAKEGNEQCDNGTQNGKDGLCANDCSACVQLSPPLCAAGTHLVTNPNFNARGCRQPATCQADAVPVPAATCLTEGTITAVTPTTKPCCTGLTGIVFARRNSLGLCEQSQGTLVCTKCGDGVCGGLGENVCNCPRDCGGISTTTPQQPTSTTPVARSSSSSSRPAATPSSASATTAPKPTSTTTTKSALATAVSVPTSVALGDTVTFTVIVMNKGPVNVPDIAVRALGNSALTFLPAASSACVTKGIDIFCDEGGNGKTVPAGGKATFTLAYRTGDRSSCGRALLLFLRTYSLSNKAVPNDVTAKVTARCPGT